MEIDPKTLSAPSLAYLGDAVLELLVRERLLECGFTTSKALNANALKFVRASAQAAAMEHILPLLTEEELGTFHRGRNIGHTNTPKSATVAEYRVATGMEALFGYLHFTKQEQRLRALFDTAYPKGE